MFFFLNVGTYNFGIYNKYTSWNTTNSIEHNLTLLPLKLKWSTEFQAQTHNQGFGAVSGGPIM